MRGENQRPHQEGNGSRTASHAVYTPPIDSSFSLFSCPDKISQQSHKSGPYALAIASLGLFRAVRQQYLLTTV